MPPSSIIQTGVFAAGLILGVGASSLLSSKRSATNTTNSTVQNPPSRPILDVNSTAGPSKQLVFGDAAYEVSREVFRYGFPGPIPDILKRTAYVAAYDRRMRHPAWTAEHLTAASLMRSPSPTTAATPQPDPYAATTMKRANPLAKGDRSRSQFIEDGDVPGMFRAMLSDYYNSGYDRGHLVPAADAKFSQIAMDETFLLTNIAPQVGDGFNRHYWAWTEDFVRRLTGKFEDVYVFTIPLYLPSQGLDGKWRVSYEVIGNPPSISVPTHFAKVVLTSSQSRSSNVKDLTVGAFVLPNAIIPDETPLTKFVVPVEAVERAAGLTLFSPQVKSTAKQLCLETKCEVIVRYFDDAAKKGGRPPGPKRRNSM